MIVKNEAGVIQRCLESVRGLVDYWVLCDTGSKDGTQALVRRSLEGTAGELHERPWVDFGHNRSELMGLARGKADYLLLLDADWTIAATPGALDHLTADAYPVRVEADEIAYYNDLLVRGDRDWRYLGSVHECIQAEGPFSEERLEGALVTNCLDGGVGRERRWRQDVQMLEQALERDPAAARTLFYLAQTYSGLGEAARAIACYERRAALGGWREEVFVSLWQIGVLRLRLGDWTEAVPALVDAWNYMPSRIEPVYQLARGYRERGANHAAHLFALRGLNRPEPEAILLTEPWIYRWGLLFEDSICAYWVGDAPAALEACDRLLAMPDLPDPVRKSTVMNRLLVRGRHNRDIEPGAPSATPDAHTRTSATA